MTDQKDTAASFTSDAETLNKATRYNTATWGVLPIATREFCPKCGGVICIYTDTSPGGEPVRATFVRLHMQCVKP